jgi:hypothetical protein
MNRKLRRVLVSLWLAMLSAVLSPVMAADEFNCSSGPFRLLLPKTYGALIKLGKVRTFADGNVPDATGTNVRHRLIEFDGMSLWIVRRSDLAEGYKVSYAVITSPKWKLLPFRVGQVPPPSTQAMVSAGLIPATGSWQLEGDTDLLKVQMQDGKVKSLTLDCQAD